MEPAFRSHNHQAADATTNLTIDNKISWTEPPGSRGLHTSTPTDEAPETRLKASGSESGIKGESLLQQYVRAGLGSTSSSHRWHPDDAADASAQRRPVHVAYRHSDLEPVRSQQQDTSRGMRGDSASLSSTITSRGNKDTKLEKREEREGRRLSSEGNHRRRRLSLESKGFRMPAAIENGMGSAGNEGPFGAFSTCPSSPRVFQIGMAMDTGFFKVLVRTLSQ